MAGMTMGRLAKFAQLPGAEKIALVEAAILVVTAWLLTRLAPYAWWTRLLGPAREVGETGGPLEETQTSRIVGWAVETAARQLPFKVVCLPQAMAGKWMLARRKVASTLCIGVRKTPPQDGAEMHAWLAVAGGSGDEGSGGGDYRIIARFGPSGGPHHETA
jgi:hypothetical protein